MGPLKSGKNPNTFHASLGWNLGARVSLVVIAPAQSSAVEMIPGELQPLKYPSFSGFSKERSVFSWLVRLCCPLLVQFLIFTTERLNPAFVCF